MIAVSLYTDDAVGTTLHSQPYLYSQSIIVPPDVKFETRSCVILICALPHDYQHRAAYSTTLPQ
jgi:hypothetical protein